MLQVKLHQMNPSVVVYDYVIALIYYGIIICSPLNVIRIMINYIQPHVQHWYKDK